MKQGICQIYAIVLFDDGRARTTGGLMMSKTVEGLIEDIEEMGVRDQAEVAALAEARRAQAQASVQVQVENAERRGRELGKESQWAILFEAWGVIANANGGNWETASPEWKAAAERIRDKIFPPQMSGEYAMKADMAEGSAPKRDR